MTDFEKQLYSDQTGMSVSDIDDHLAKFDNGGSYLVRDDAFEAFTEGKPMLGYDDNSNYILSSDEMDKIIADSNGDIGYIEKQLGFPDGYFGDGPIHRVDVPNPSEHNIRMANGTEKGGNLDFNTPLNSDGKSMSSGLNNEGVSWPPRDAEGAKNWPYKSPDNPDKNLPVIDSTKQDPAVLGNLNGEYFDQNGNYHAPNLSGYTGETSGGGSEAVVDRMGNTPENVNHSTYDGFERGKASDHMTHTPNDNAYFQPSAIVNGPDNPPGGGGPDNSLEGDENRNNTNEGAENQNTPNEGTGNQNNTGEGEGSDGKNNTGEGAGTSKGMPNDAGGQDNGGQDVGSSKGMPNDAGGQDNGGQEAGTSKGMPNDSGSQATNEPQEVSTPAQTDGIGM